MRFRNTLISLVPIALSLCLGLASQTHAEPDSAFDDIPLNGLASYVQLRKEYYIGGLYLQSLNQDSGAVFSFSGRKRMDLRITIDEWSPRRFGQQWNQAILINNDQEDLERFANEILAFIDLPKDDLVAGDRITVDLDPNLGTLVYLNNQEMFRVKDTTFFDVLLNTWIGQRPPSSDFRDDILTLPTDQEGTDLLVRYQATIPTEQREKKAASWSGKSAPSKSAAVATVAAAGAGASSAAAPPPGSGTTVTAKRSKAEAPKTPKPAAVAAPAAIAAPKLELEKPTLAAAPAAQPQPAPKPAAKPAPKPKPEPKPAAKPEKAVAKQETAADKERKEQEKLLRTYRSNVLKLTYLNTQYPKRAMDFKQEGLVVLKVTINRNGKVEDIEEETSSDHKLLNKAAKSAVKKTAPFPEIPDSITGENVVVTLPFNFRL